MHNKTWVNKSSISWMQKILFERYGYPFVLTKTYEQSIQISLSGESRTIDVLTDTSNFTRSDSNMPCAEWNSRLEGLYFPRHDLLPMPGMSMPVYPLIVQTDGGYQIRYDVLGLTYWILTRQEEINRIDLDSHERFIATSSHAFKYGYLERPIVDEWLGVLAKVIMKVWPQLRLRQNRFRMVVSHDVDEPSRYGYCSFKEFCRAISSDFLKYRDVRKLAKACQIRLNRRTRLHSDDPFNTFEWLMSVSEKYNLKSAFYFICGHTNNEYDAKYDIRDRDILQLMQRINNRNHELGVHFSYGSYKSRERMNAEVEKLREVMRKFEMHQTGVGARTHFLKWEQPTTLTSMDQVGITYDTSLGFADRPGFRCGTAFEYPAFDPVKVAELSIRIRPLIAMDCSVTAKRYLNLGFGKEALTKFLELKEECRSVGGCFTLLWHNSELLWPVQRELYQSILASSFNGPEGQVQ